MASLSNDLAAWRNLAAQRSGGTSADSIKDLVLRLLRQSQAHGDLLDFGAGRGELLRRLHALRWPGQLAGADLMPRPDNFPDEICWHQCDLNDPLNELSSFDVVVCSETIEHLENPRHVFRTLFQLLKPGGTLVLTMPNQECIRSLVGLLFGGHFTSFLGDCYPAHITALLRLDLQRICREVGFKPPRFAYTDEGRIPKLTALSWQGISGGLLRGRLFSDNLGLVTQRP